VSDVLSLAERVMKAFSKYNCFIFEEKELQAVRDLMTAAELKGLVEIKQVDPRYPGIYIATVWTRSIERECLSRVDILLSEGRLSENEYKKYRAELVEQCILSMERELSRKIVDVLSGYISRLRSSISQG